MPGSDDDDGDDGMVEHKQSVRVDWMQQLGSKEYNDLYNQLMDSKGANVYNDEHIGTEPDILPHINGGLRPSDAETFRRNADAVHLGTSYDIQKCLNSMHNYRLKWEREDASSAFCLREAPRMSPVKDSTGRRRGTFLIREVNLLRRIRILRRLSYSPAVKLFAGILIRWPG